MATAARQEDAFYGWVRFVAFTKEGINAQAGQLVDSGAFDVIQLQYNLFFQHPYDPDKHAGQMLDAEAKAPRSP